MRTIEFTGQFKRDYKRESKGAHKKTLIDDLNNAFKLLASDKKLPEKYYDHPLVGNWKDHRDCHIKPDLVLIYRKPDETTLQLVRLGSHSQLGI
jgi:mRNA interferase YafQ